MNTVSIDVKDMLEAAGLGLEYKKNLFIAKEPDNPDNCVTVFDTPSFPPEYDIAGQSYYRSSCQIRIRNNGYTDGMTVARNILDSLHARVNLEAWNGTVYTVIEATGEPAQLAWDDNNRAIIIINFNFQRR
jgi:hypothetical protein